MAPMLPPDIILLICEELGNQRAFGTLFNAALSSKQIAASALLWMYRYFKPMPQLSMALISMKLIECPARGTILSWSLLTPPMVHTTSAIRTGENTEDEIPKNKTANSAMSRWALQWRSIILSSLGETAYPYCLYIRTLDLTNLNDLFDDLVFKKDFESKFFEGSMSVLKKSPGATTRRPKLNMNSVAIVDMVGELISKYAGDSAERNGGTAALEELSGEIQKDSLPKWIRRLPRLKALTLWRGMVLNADVADAIRDHCPDFKSLTLYFGLGKEVDTNLSHFFMGLRSNTLRSLQVISFHDCGPQTFLSLNNHSTSLRHLSLGNLQGPALSSLSLLKGCTAIETLYLQDLLGRTDLEATENDVYLEFISWLKSCKQLKNISLENFVNGPRILTSVCLEHTIKLDSLHLAKYTLAGNQDFHRALAHQTSLTSLHLKGEHEDSFRDDIDTLVTSLGKLKNLKYLNILDISDYFSTSEIQQLALSLPKVEFSCIRISYQRLSLMSKPF
jgi:hypothetical protein